MWRRKNKRHSSVSSSRRAVDLLLPLQLGAAAKIK
jgi:hypothetical protein